MFLRLNADKLINALGRSAGSSSMCLQSMNAMSIISVFEDMEANRFDLSSALLLAPLFLGPVCM